MVEDDPGTMVLADIRLLAHVEPADTTRRHQHHSKQGACHHFRHALASDPLKTHQQSELALYSGNESQCEAQKIQRLSTIFIASDAVEFLSQSAPATVLCSHPGTFNVWWIVANVLIMAAFQLGHPVTFFIEMKSGDLSLHCRSYPPAPHDAKLARPKFTAVSAGHI